jgi:PAS domain S-box-containing protein
VGAIESIRDITEYKQAEKALRAGEEQFRQLFENMSNCVAIYEAVSDGEDFIFKAFNRAAEKVEGVAKETIIGKSVLEVFPGVKEFGLFEVFKRVWKTGNPEFHPTKLYQDDRISGWKENFVYKLPSGEVVAIYEDVTIRKQAEETLRQTQLQQKALLDNIPDAAWLKDSESRFIAVNEAFARAAGYSAEALVGKTDFNIWSKDEAELYRSEDQEVILTKQKKVIEQSIVSLSGKVTWVEKIKTPIVNEENEVIGTVGISCDITQRKQTEEVLRENEKKYRSLYQEFQGILDAIPDSLMLINPDFQVIWANEGLAAIMNRNLSDLVGKHCYQIWHSRPEPCAICPVQRSFGSKQSEFEEISISDGRIWDVRTVPILGDQGEVKAVIESARNITEKKKAFQDMISLQAQLRQSQKMEAIARLAGGVAHDFNNLLTVIQANSELALNELAADDHLRPRVDDIKSAAERAAYLIRQLLAFSRRQALNLKVIDVNSILEDLEKMLCRIIGEEIELITSFADDLGMIKADPGEVEQVIINLAVNAKDAMPQGGTLTLTTANVELDEQYTRTHFGTLPGSYVVISLTDTGVGIPQEIHEKIFDPFFTTKKKGKGTGLGLATVYGIVRQSGGNIHLYSEPEKGTTFKVYLPRFDEPLVEAKKKTEFNVLPQGNETILVVEDDGAVRKIAVQVLTAQGYNVLVAETGGDALLICEQEKKPIHLVLTDVVMPKMSGPELIERLKKVRKDFTVLYMSGYTDKNILRCLDYELNFIQKPFTIDVLAKKVRDSLDNTKKGSERK